MADRKNSRSKSTAPAPELAVVETLFKFLWRVIVWAFGRLRGNSGFTSKKSAQRAELAALRSHWDTIEAHAINPATYTMAISEADKILDNAFKIIGLPGQTMGDRLKASENYFDSSLYQSIWSAHKQRNVLAHEVGAHVSSTETAQAITAFRTALYQLGVFE